MTPIKAVQHAFWLFGIIAGLAIKSALETSVPHLLNPQRLINELARVGEINPYPHTMDGVGYLEILRLVVFLILILRFITGSAFYFGEAYESANADVKYPRKNYGIDLTFGFVHFMFFFGLALTIDLHTTSLRWFPFFIALILTYDAFWWFFSSRNSTGKLLFWWMIINLFTALLSALIYVAVGGWKGPIKGEIWAIWPVMVVSLMDIGLMMNQRPFFNVVSDLAPPPTPRGNRVDNQS